MVMKIATHNTQQVQQRAVADTSQRLNTSADTFGAAGARVVGAAGDMVFDASKSLMIKENNAVMRENLNGYRRESTALLKSFQQKRGRDAHDGREEMDAQLTEVRKKYSGNLSSGLSDEFMLRSEEYDINYKSKASDHAFKGFNEWEVASIEANIEGAQQDIAAMPEDAYKYTAQIESEVTAKLKRLGLSGDPEIVEQETMKALTVAHKSAIDGLIEDNPMLAKAYYEKHEDQILPTVRDDIKKKIGDQTSAANAQRAADVAIATGSESDARAYIKKNITDPIERKAANSLIADEFSVRDRELKRGQSEIVNEIDLARRNGVSVVSWASKNSAKWEALTPSQRKTLEKTGAIETDWAVYDQVERLITTGDVKSEAELRSQFGGQINKYHLNVLVKEWKKSGEISNSELRRLYTDFTGNKLGTPSKPLSGNAAKEWNAFKSYITDGLKESHRPEDLEKMASRWIAKGDNVASSPWVVGDDPETYGQAVATGFDSTFERDLPETVDPVGVRALFTGAKLEGNTKQNYWNFYVPALDWLQAHNMTPSDKNLTAVMILESNNRVVNADTIEYVTKQLR